MNVLIPYRSQHNRAESLACVMDHYRRALPGCLLALADDPDPRAFNRGRALNEAVRRTQGEVLIFADADLLPPPENIREAVRLVQEGSRSIVIPFSRIAYLSPAGTREVTRASDWRNWGPVYVEREWDRRSNGGANVLSRSYFEALGGYDDRFRGWGYEDSALALAWETFWDPQHWLEGTAVHLWHPSNTELDIPLREQCYALCLRYEAAFKNEGAMQSLLEEARAARCPSTSSSTSGRRRRRSD